MSAPRRCIRRNSGGQDLGSRFRGRLQQGSRRGTDLHSTAQLPLTADLDVTHRAFPNCCESLIASGVAADGSVSAHLDTHVPHARDKVVC